MFEAKNIPANDAHPYYIPIDYSGRYLSLHKYEAKKRSPRLDSPDRQPVLILHSIDHNVSSTHKIARYFALSGRTAYTVPYRSQIKPNNFFFDKQDFEHILHDLLQAINWVKKLEGGTLPILFGVKKATPIVVEFAKQHPDFVDHIALFDPQTPEPLQPKDFFQKFLFHFSRVIHREILPHTLKRRFFAFDLTKKKQTKTRSRITLNFYYQYLRSCKFMISRIAHFNKKMLIVLPHFTNIEIYQRLSAVISKNQKNNLEIAHLLAHDETPTSPETTAIKAAMELDRWAKTLEAHKPSLGTMNIVSQKPSQEFYFNPS